MPRKSAATASNLEIWPARPKRRRAISPGGACESFSVVRESSIPSVQETGRICAGVVCTAAFDAERAEHFTRVLARSIATARR
jgi:hypothetical protein